jgi:hypothetical protein
MVWRDLSAQLLRPVAAASAGAGLSSVAQAAAPSPSIGPEAVVLFGHAVPVWSAIFGLVGVFLARRVAPISPAEAQLGAQGRLALTLLLALGVLALIVTGEKRPIVALGWSVGLGYSGLAFVHLVATSVVALSRMILDSFAGSIAKAASAWVERKGSNRDG